MWCARQWRTEYLGATGRHGRIDFAYIGRVVLLTLGLYLPIIPLTVLTLDFGKRVTELFFHVDTVLGDLSARLQENVTGVQVIRAFAREPYEMEKFDAANRTFMRTRLATRLVLAALSRPVTVVIAVVTLAIASALAVRRMPADIFPELADPAIYVAQPYGGMDPAQMDGFLTYYYEYHFL